MRKGEKIEAIIVDDELDSIEVLIDIIRDSCPTIELVGVAQSVDEGIKLIDSKDPQLVLLDIQMPGKTGFDLLKANENRQFHTIFISAHENYALEAIKYHAMAYLLKPIGAEELCEAVEEVKTEILKDKVVSYAELLQHLTAQSEKRIAIPTGGGHLYFKPDEILRVEAAKNYSKVFTTSSSKFIMVSKNLKQFENLLSNYGFIRIHHAHVINPRHIREFVRQDGGAVLLTDGTSVFIGNSYKDQVLEYLFNTSDKV